MSSLHLTSPFIKWVFILTFTTFCTNDLQAQCQDQSTGSVNAYYDAIRLSQYANDLDECNSKQVISILSAYNKSGSSFNFDTDEIADLYELAIRKIFNLDKLFTWFDNLSGPNAVTGKTRELFVKVMAYQNLKDRQASNDKLQMHLETAESIYNTIITDTVSFAADVPGTAKKLNILFDTTFAKDTAAGRFLSLQNVDTTDRLAIVAAAEAIILQVESATATSARAINTELSKKIADIQKFFVQNYADLDKNLKIAMGGESKEKTYLKSSNDMSAQNTLMQSNAHAEALYNSNETFTLTNFKMPSQTEVIDALAIYLAKRFKQEVALSLVEQFRKIVKNDELIYDLFPETVKMFSTGKVYEMPSFGSAWNYAISKDFTTMLPNLAKSPYVIKKIGDSIMVNHFQDIVRLCGLINKQYSFVDAISQMYHQRGSKSFLSQNITTLYIINKEMFDTTNVAKFWISPEKLYSLDEQQLNLMYALIREKYDNNLGIISSELGKEQLMQCRNMLSSTLVLLNNFQAERNKMLQMKPELQAMQSNGYWNFLTDLFETLNHDVDENSPKYIKSGLNVINHSLETYDLINQKNYAGAALKLLDLLPLLQDDNFINLRSIIISQDRWNKIISTSDNMKQLTIKSLIDRFDRVVKQYYYAKNFSTEIAKSTSDYRNLANDPRTTFFQNKAATQDVKAGAKPMFISKTNTRTSLISILVKDTLALRDSIIALQKLIEHDNNYKQYHENDISKVVYHIINISNDKIIQQYINNSSSKQFDTYRKITSFLSDVLVSGNSRNLSQVIEKYAMPPNSYQIKRHSRTSWDVNAYVGGYVGGEFLKDNGNTNLAGVYGFSAPVGLAYSWGTRRKNKHAAEATFTSRRRYTSLSGNAMSITLSIIDIGAVVSYRITNDASKGLPQDVKWSQLISPNLALRYGIKSTPFCASIGIQSTPQLRKLSSTQPATSAVRVYAGLFCDLPLLNIMHR